MPNLQFGNRALKTRRFDDEWRLAIELHGDLFRAETARRWFFAPQPQSGRFRFQPIGFAETPGQFRRRRAPIQRFDLAVVMHPAVPQTNHASRLRQHGPRRVRREDERGISLRQILADDLPVFSHAAWVHMYERFVHHQHRRVGGQRAGDRQPRLFASRKRVGTAAAAVRKVEFLQPPVCLCFLFGALFSDCDDVFRNRQVRP